MGGKSPDPPKLSPRGGRAIHAEEEHKHEKRGSSPSESMRDVSTKKRRRSGRLHDVDNEKDELEPVEKQARDDDGASHGVEKKGKTSERTRHESRGKVADEREKGDRDAKGKVKEATDREVGKDQEKVDKSSLSGKEQTSGRRRTRSGRFDEEEKQEPVNQNQKQDGKADHPDSVETTNNYFKQSCSSGQDKGKEDTARHKISPGSPERARRNEPTKVELLDLNLDEHLAKTAGKQAPKSALSPPLRMSPRRARQLSGQKSSTYESAESKDMQDVQSNEEIVTQSASVSEELDKEGAKVSTEVQEKQKKSCPVNRDLQRDFDEAEETPKSPTRLTRARNEQDAHFKSEAVSSKEDNAPASPTKLSKLKKSRSPVKPPRDGAPLSPRKGLRSCRTPEATPGNEAVAKQDKVVEGEVSKLGEQMEGIVVATGESLLSMHADETSKLQDEGKQMIREQILKAKRDSTPQSTHRPPEQSHTPGVREMLAMEKQTEEDEVTEISDEVAAKIKEWKVQEEGSVGFQGDEWYIEEVDEGEPFYYESDHMALKGNKDYRMLLRTITTLEAQRKQAIKDLDKLVTAQREALRNPLKFVHKLQKKDTLHLPSAQRIVMLPEIPWGRYLGHADSTELIQGLSHQTRAKQKDDPGAGTSASDIDMLNQEMDEKNKNVIRGRMWDETKPDTFNRLWTVGEQKRLEDLLLKFPSEEVEARRWEKVAKELGNRTRHQVASRVQKFFIKLSKAGLPVPGRLPNLATYTSKKPQQRRFVNPYNRLTMAPSTFLQSIRAPVLMNDDDDVCDFDMDFEADSLMEEDDIPTELRDSEEYRELVRLKKLRNITLKQQSDISHAGYSCDGCGVSPIVGVRWHCVNCPTEISTDLCQNCVDDEFQSEVHTASHDLEPIHSSQASGFIDSDYTSFTGTSGDYNYLDPNYSPAIL